MASPITIGTTRGLRAALAQIDQEGWDSPTGSAVLTYAAERIVRPAVSRAGLRGPMAEQAQATGWETAWEVLRTLGPRARSPWGAVTVAVRRAVRGEMVAAAYCTSPRTAWQLRRDFAPTVSLHDLPVAGWDADAGSTPTFGPTLDALADAMVSVGWCRADVEVVVDWVVARAGRGRSGSTGWRVLASSAGLPPWRVRRAMALLLGDAGWPGLVERAARDGAAVLERAESRAALRSSVRSSHLSPASAARRALTAERRAS